MSKRILILAIAALTLMGCASGPKPMPVTLTPPPRLPPASLLVPCEVPPPPTSGALSYLLSNHVEAMEIMHRCARRLNALIEYERNAIRHNNNTNEPHIKEQ